ncbi:MAG: hypothetical protein ACKN9U_00195, partial [Pirellulaceae bacterium]
MKKSLFIRDDSAKRWSSRHPDRFSWTGRRIALFVMQESRCTGLVETLDGGFDGQVQGLTK